MEEYRGDLLTGARPPAPKPCAESCGESIGRVLACLSCNYGCRCCRRGGADDADSGDGDEEDPRSWTQKICPSCCGGLSVQQARAREERAERARAAPPRVCGDGGAMGPFV